MKTTLRTNVLIVVSLGLAFSAILFQDILIVVALLIALLMLFAEALWLAIVTTKPKSWFKISHIDAAEEKTLHSGESASDRFLLTKKGSGSVSITLDVPFLRVTPSVISSGEHSREILMEFKTPYAGEYVLRELKLSVLGPLHLFVRDCALPLLKVKKYSVRPQVLQVAIASAKLLGKSGIGETPINAPGIGTEFYDMRNYQIGDDYRNINWKATARRGQLIINERMKEVGGSYYVVLEAKAQNYFDRDRLSATFLQLANSLTMLRTRFGVIIHDGEKIVAVKRIGAPEDSLSFALRAAFDLVDIKENDLPEELIGVARYTLKENEDFMSSQGFSLLSEIEKSGRLNLKRSVGNGEPFREILSIVGESESVPPAVLYINSAFGSLNLAVELGSEFKRRYGAEFILINPTMPWVVATNEIEAYELYKKFLGKLRAFSLSNIEYAVGEPAAIASRIFET